MQVSYLVRPDLAENILKCVRYIGTIAHGSSGYPAIDIHLHMPVVFRMNWIAYTRQLCRPTFISLGKNHGTAHVDLLHYEPNTLIGIQIRVWGVRFNYLIEVDAQGKPDSVLDIHGAETGFASILGMQEVYDLLSELTPVPA